MQKSSPNILSLAGALVGLGGVKKRPGDAPPAPIDFYQLRVYTVSGEAIDLEDYKGRKLLIVNVASKCGFTPQYEGLQQLLEQHADKVTLLGFPANNFKHQEPGSNKDIEQFCQLNYGVTFPVMEKISVLGKDQHPLYRWLSRKDFNGWCSQEPEWNFAKYLVNEEGQLTHYFNPAVKPMSKAVLRAIGALS